MNKDKLKTIGALCRKIRRDANMTQAQMADLVGCSHSLISMFESGNVNSLVVLTAYVNIASDSHKDDLLAAFMEISHA